jgi:hypothetical protein
MLDTGGQAARISYAVMEMLRPSSGAAVPRMSSLGGQEL